MTALVERNLPGDFLKEYWSENYNFEAATIKNVSGATIAAGAMYPGLPLNLNSGQWETIAAGSVSGFDGFFVDERSSESLANNGISTKKYRILARGPAVVNLDMVANDLDAGTAYNKATVLTQMAALLPLITQLREPTAFAEQTK